jgi:hypothetical protein
LHGFIIWEVSGDLMEDLWVVHFLLSFSC